MNVKPLRRSSCDSALDAGVQAGTSARVTGARAGAVGVVPDQRGQPVGQGQRGPGVGMAASILARFRTMPGSPSSRATSAGPKPATAAMSKPQNAARKASRLRKIVSQDRPGLERLQAQPLEDAPRSSRTGRPHSSS